MLVFGTPKKFPPYGFKGTCLLFPVELRIRRIDRTENREATNTTGTFGYSDVFDEISRTPSGVSNLQFHDPIYVLGQFVPPGATEHSNKADPGINTVDYSTRQEYLLSAKNLRSLGLIDPVTENCLLGAGDRLISIHEPETHKLIDTIQSEVVIKEIHPRTPGSKTLYYVSFEDVAQGSEIMN